MGNAIGKQFQPMVKDAGGVLVGVMQVRTGKPSIRPAGTAVTKALQFVGTSSLLSDTSTGATIKYIRPLDMSTGGTLPTGCTIEVAGTYTGDYDGCFVIRAVDSAKIDILAPNGYLDEAVLLTEFASTPYDMKLGSSETSGVTIEGVPATSLTAGQTFIIPVWSGTAQDRVQTGIISPYSMFSGSNESVGGLSDASFLPKVSSIKTLESGYPAVQVDAIVEKTTVDIKFTAYEYLNDNIKQLKDMISQVINDAKLPAIPVELVCRTRSNKLISFWLPSCSLTQFPDVSPKNEFSQLSWELSAAKATEISGETDAYNVNLANTYQYYELEYTH